MHPKAFGCGDFRIYKSETLPSRALDDWFCVSQPGLSFTVQHQKSRYYITMLPQKNIPPKASSVTIRAPTLILSIPLCTLQRHPWLADPHVHDTWSKSGALPRIGRSALNILMPDHFHLLDPGPVVALQLSTAWTNAEIDVHDPASIRNRRA